MGGIGGMEWGRTKVVLRIFEDRDGEGRMVGGKWRKKGGKVG